MKKIVLSSLLAMAAASVVVPAERMPSQTGLAAVYRF